MPEISDTFGGLPEGTILEMPTPTGDFKSNFIKIINVYFKLSNFVLNDQSFL
ncbi:hypothetical protein ACPCXA_17950 [Lysinibacillus agricola]